MIWILNKITEAQYMVEEMGASEELTALSVKLSEIKEDCEKYQKSVDQFCPPCGS